MKAFLVTGHFADPRKEQPFSIEMAAEDETAVREKVSHIALANPYVLQLHGFYLNKEEKTMRFDLVVSFDAEDRRQVLQEIREEVQKEFPDYELQIILDTDFSE